MNTLPLSESEAGAIALTMAELGLTHNVAPPETPQPVPGREHECIQAGLGMPTVRLDDELRAYTESYQAYLAWRPQQPRGICVHKLAAPGWIVAANEVTAALAVLTHTSSQDVRAALRNRFGPAGVAVEVWEDWIKLLRGSADSGYPIFLSAPDHEDRWAIAELHLEQASLTL
ncbi:hypothetical protein [Streptomyces nanshensis]|uniref:Uncharacterized protein n=1 Tax=Streptomyces nanshensis TaxID=518642 RepID=A0A1E7L5R7_9ACTN|nr:hypothetical protein [Streptomyces nanshensis]OEV11542.1 hypothetical protein AN218_12385 [Streptomyces nanshensis]